MATPILAITGVANAGIGYTFESAGSSFRSVGDEGDGYAECFFAANSPTGPITHDLAAFKSFNVTLQAPAGQQFVAKAVPGATSRDLTIYLVGGTPEWDWRGQPEPEPTYWTTFYSWTPEIDIDNISFGGWSGTEIPSVIYGSMQYYTDDGTLAGDGGLPGQACFDGSLSLNLGLAEMSFTSISFDVHAPISADTVVTLDSEYGLGDWSKQIYAFADAYGDEVGDPGQWLTTSSLTAVPEVTSSFTLLGLISSGLMLRRRERNFR
jgi:hypothetical protein